MNLQLKFQVHLQTQTLHVVLSSFLYIEIKTEVESPKNWFLSDISK